MSESGDSNVNCLYCSIERKKWKKKKIALVIRVIILNGLT